MLKEEVIANFSNTPDINDVDSKEAFLAKAIAAKAILKFLEEPDSRISLIESQNK